MKKLISPIVIIVSLIAFFAIIDRKATIRHDDGHTADVVQTGQDESIESSRKRKSYPVSTQETKTGKETYSTKSISAVEPQSSETYRSADIIDNRPAPAAVPVVTPEEAERLNEEALKNAIAEKEKKEPFYQLYENCYLETVIYEGTIRAVSAVPDPEKNDYDDCLYALFVEIDSLLSDVTPDKKIACEAIINASIMKNKEILPDNKFLPGDKVWCRCAEYDAMAQGIQEIQLSDDIQSYEHQQYYPLEIRKIASFSNGGNRNFSKREITIFPIQSLPKDKKAETLRKERIQNEIAQIEEKILKHGGSFESWKEEYTPVVEKYKKLCAENYKGWINDSYYAAGAGDPIYRTQAYIDGILPYKQYLNKNNIDLIVLRIPNKWEFSRCVLTSNVFQDDPAWIEHYYECLKNDIEIIDPMPAMWEHRFDYPFFYFYNDPSEMHPFEGTSFISAMVLSDCLRRYSFPSSDNQIELVDGVFKIDQNRYFWPEGNNKFNSKENISYKRVFYNNKSIGALTVNTGSPFLFLSNSFFAYPHREQGASVPAYTAFFLQHVPDWFYQHGTHNPMIRNLFSRSFLLNSRKAVIMVGHPDDWNGFPPLPKYIQDNPEHITLEKTLYFQDMTAIHNNDSFLQSVDKNNSISFSAINPPASSRINQFDMEFQIPYIENKKNCMIRISFDKTTFISLDLVKDKDSHVIDTCTLSPGENLSADLFFPLSISNESKANVKLIFRPKHYSNSHFSIKNIELWYY